MAQIDDLIATYLNAVETEGKSVRIIKSYRDSLANFRLVGRRLGFPDAVGDHDVTHVYAFLAEVRARRGRSGRATTTPHLPVGGRAGARAASDRSALPPLEPARVHDHSGTCPSQLAPRAREQPAGRAIGQMV